MAGAAARCRQPRGRRSRGRSGSRSARSPPRDRCSKKLTREHLHKGPERLAPGPCSRPDLPALLSREDRDRVCHRGVGSPVEMLPEKGFQFPDLQPEGRAALAVFEEEKSGDPAPRPEPLDYALHIARPQRARQRAQEGALVHEVERPVEIEFKEIFETNEMRDRS